MESLTPRAGVSAGPATGGRSFVMSTRASVVTRKREALPIGSGHMKRVRITAPMVLSVLG